GHGADDHGGRGAHAAGGDLGGELPDVGDLVDRQVGVEVVEHDRARVAERGAQQVQQRALGGGQFAGGQRRGQREVEAAAPGGEQVARLGATQPGPVGGVVDVRRDAQLRVEADDPGD